MYLPSCDTFSLYFRSIFTHLFSTRWERDSRARGARRIDLSTLPYFKERVVVDCVCLGLLRKSTGNSVRDASENSRDRTRSIGERERETGWKLSSRRLSGSLSLARTHRYCRVAGAPKTEGSSPRADRGRVPGARKERSDASHGKSGKTHLLKARDRIHLTKASLSLSLSLSFRDSLRESSRALLSKVSVPRSCRAKTTIFPAPAGHTSVRAFAKKRRIKKKKGARRPGRGTLPQKSQVAALETPHSRRTFFKKAQQTSVLFQRAALWGAPHAERERERERERNSF